MWTFIVWKQPRSRLRSDRRSLTITKWKTKFFFLFLFAPTDPPDCSNISCDQWCPLDSDLIQHASAVTTTTGASLPADASSAKVKRAVASYKRRESIKITPVYDPMSRLRRDIETNDFVEYETTEDKARAICCAKQAIEQCKCNYSKCKAIQCEPHESKILTQSDSDEPGKCCETHICSHQRPTCFSTTLKRHFAVNETWNDDDCTHCECTEKGDPHCTSSVCKALSCEKIIRKAGQCCPECDFSGSKYCVGEEYCDLHCRNGFDIDPTNGCSICRCAKATTTSTTSAPASSPAPSDPSSTQHTVSDIHTDENVHNISDTRTGAAPASTTDDSWFVHSPIILGICITIAAFVIVVSLSCRYMTHNKGKHRFNRKQKSNKLTPLI